MPNEESSTLPIAVRVYPQQKKEAAQTRQQRAWKRPDAMLVFDTETRTDATQRLLFGSYQYFVNGQCLKEGLFYSHDLSDEEKKSLVNYAATHRARTARESSPELLLLTLREFLDKFYRAIYKGRCLLVGFNLPFDISRIAYDFSNARGRFAGGFSFGLWTHVDKNGQQTRNQFRPRIGIKQIDSKRALKGFTARNNPDATDLIPEGSLTGKPEDGYIFRGHLLDLRTLAFALTDRGHTLESACKEFGVEHGKEHAEEHGIITEKYVDYNRNDVLATYELSVKLLEEYDKHPITLQATQAYSPATIGKSYLRTMGVKPILERQPDFPKQYLGYAQSAFFGGRTSAHIRKTPVPVVYTDFLSMYPTVNILMGLWSFVTAERITIVEHCEAEINRFLSSITPDILFNRAIWKCLPAFVRIISNDDILPSRSKYSSATNDWQVAVNRLYSDGKTENALWYSLPDAVASVILSGKVPKIIDAFRMEAHGTLPDLQPIKLRGVVEIDPRNQDFFKVVIEERKRLGSRTNISEIEQARLDKALKVLANATSYGIYAEMIREESEEAIPVTCYGIDAEPFTCRVTHPDNPGAYCFPPLASLITGAARLMLALLERCVSDLKGTYAMEDTDSMAIVSTEHGGLVPCAGGNSLINRKQQAVLALSWKQVDEIAERFAHLNPYDRNAVPESILKIEKDNYDSSGNRQQLYCYAISAKRYTNYVLNEKSEPVLLRWSEHGLGHLLNPVDIESTNRDWIKQVWLTMVRTALKLPVEKLAFAESPALSLCSISSPAVARPLRFLNEDKDYSKQIKPFNFLLTCHVNPLGHPVGTNPEQFHLIAPYDSDPKKWVQLNWIDQYSGKIYSITTEEYYGARDCARVKTYEDIIVNYGFHPEAKCADANGNRCNKQTIGLLKRRKVFFNEIRYIGKESNLLEEVESGMIHSAEAAYTEYPDKSRDEWETKIRPAIKRIPLSILVTQTGMSRSQLKELRAGRSRPHRKNKELISLILRKDALV